MQTKLNRVLYDIHVNFNEVKSSLFLVKTCNVCVTIAEHRRVLFACIEIRSCSSLNFVRRRDQSIIFSSQDECGSIKQLFHVNYKRTSFLLAFMWMTIAMSYYGIILINTSLMTLDNEQINLNRTSSSSTSDMNTNRCRMLTTADYQSMIFTTFGEMFGIPLLIFLLSRFGRRTICTLNFSAASFCFAMFLLTPYGQPWMINLLTFGARMFINSQFSLMYLYTMEVYPTVIRAMAVGCASSMARVGAMITPFLAQVLIRKTFTGTIGIYVIMTALAATCACFLPIETRGRELRVRIVFNKPD
jgi:MFS family permease